LVGKPAGKRLLGTTRHGRIIILNCILKKFDRRHGLD
jgi:hypothetical protein